MNEKLRNALIAGGVAAMILGLRDIRTYQQTAKDPVTGKRPPFEWDQFATMVIGGFFTAFIGAMGYQSADIAAPPVPVIVTTLPA